MLVEKMFKNIMGVDKFVALFRGINSNFHKVSTLRGQVYLTFLIQAETTELVGAIEWSLKIYKRFAHQIVSNERYKIDFHFTTNTHNFKENASIKSLCLNYNAC